VMLTPPEIAFTYALREPSMKVIQHLIASAP
jgi:hypothetical protein